MSIEPPATDTDNPPAAKKPSAKRTLLLWLVLIVMFIVIYQVFDDGSPHDGPPPFWTQIGVFDLIPWLLLATVVGWLTWNLRSSTRYYKAMRPGLHAFAQRRLVEAETELVAAAATAGKAPWAGPLAHYNLALVRIQRGALATAEESLAIVERWAGLAYGSDLRVLAAIELGRVNALRGRTDVARRWIDVAHRRLTRAGSAEDKRRVFLLAEVLVLLREGKPRDAVARFEQSAIELETTVPYDTMRQWWALTAFAQWQDAGVRDQGAVDMLLRRLQPSRPHELAHLVVEWPELRSFLETHGVAASALTRGS
jgi:hypothetical protein